MEAPIDVAILGSKDHMNVVKGKRTKRSRPQSPIPFVVACNNSMYNEGNRGEVLEGIPIPNVETKNCGQYLLPPSPSSFSSSFSFELYQDNTTTEEEEDMANCLILLAQGRPRESAMSRGGDHRHDVGITCNKFNSRKFMETASNGTGKVGYYVYECKTCNRTFPSFQALGGHRASHKKPKTMAPFEAAIVDEKNIRQLKATYEEGPNSKNNNVRGLNGNNNNKVKVHECSMCGAEFTSGQALGGHMRRHRGWSIGSNVNVITTNTNLSSTVPMAIESEKPKKPRNVLSLSLDLNLPAPENDHRVSELAIPSQQHHQQQQKQQQQSSLVFSTPTLVDCHY